MGKYLNPGNQGFRKTLNSEIYVDKTGLIAYTNKVVDTRQQYICVSRPRRFGKSMAAEMLAAYYGRECDSKEQFQNLIIAKEESFEKYLNQYDVIFLNMQEFLSRSRNIEDMLERIRKLIMQDLKKAYPDVEYFDETDLIESMKDVYEASKCPFVIIIDEWDCIFREYREDTEMQNSYLDFLRNFLKDKSYIALAYMTGILPIKKYGTHSALNMFQEFSMANPRQLAEYVGFTEPEVVELCEKYGVDKEEMKCWYDGYCFDGVPHIYSPKSVVESVLSKCFDNFWNQTETYEALKHYIVMNYDGLRDTIVELLAGGRKKINTNKFMNDMTTFSDKDDVLTLLIHLGYLGYSFEDKEVFIPNSEVATEFYNSMESAGWEEIIKSVSVSEKLLQAIWNQEEDILAKGIEEAHLETSILTYNDENALSYTISLALYAARNYYTQIREFPSGKGFADIVFLPRKKYLDKPAIVVELKWDKDANAAIKQIKDKRYVESLKDYTGKLLLVGINYDNETKKHECVIEEWVR